MVGNKAWRGRGKRQGLATTERNSKTMKWRGDAKDTRRQITTTTRMTTRRRRRFPIMTTTNNNQDAIEEKDNKNDKCGKYED